MVQLKDLYQKHIHRFQIDWRCRIYMRLGCFDLIDSMNKILSIVENHSCYKIGTKRTSRESLWDPGGTRVYRESDPRRWLSAQPFPHPDNLRREPPSARGAGIPRNGQERPR